MKKIPLTLAIIAHEGQVLLGMKKRGFGKGRWNGFGGKLVEGETLFQGVVREVREECGLLVQEAEQRAVIEFTFQGSDDLLEVHVFKVLSYTGAVAASEEMEPRWFLIKDIPYDKMWEDDKFWFPLLLDDKCFRAKFNFTADQKLVDYQIFE